MAGQIKGITIEIGGNTAPLDQALKDVNKNINTTQKELREVDKLLKLDPSNTTLLKQKMQLLGDQIGNTTTKLDALKQAQKKLDETMQNGGDVNQQEYRQLEREIAKAESSLTKLKDEAQKTGDQLSGASEQAKKFAEATAKISEVAKNCTKAIADFTVQGIKVMTGAIAGAIGVVGKLAKDSGALADELNTLASKTGLSTKELQEFQYASELIDVNVETLAGALKKTTSAMNSAKDGTGASADAFKTLGVNIKNADGTLRDNNDVFNESIKALGNIANETERDALAMQLFGKSATELNPLIEGGIDTLAEMSKKANDLGLILSQEAVDGANAFNDQLDILKSNGKGLFNVIGTEIANELVPTMTSLNETTEGYIKRLTTAMSENGIEGLLGEIGNVIGDIASKIAEKLPKIAEIGVNIIKQLVSSIKQNAGQIGQSASELIEVLINGFYEILPDLIETAIVLISSFIKSMGEKLPELIPTIVQGLLDVLDAIINNIDIMIEAGLKLIDGLIRGLMQAIPLLIQKVPEILSKLLTAFVENLPMIITTLTQLIIDVINFLTDPDNLLMIVNTAITFVTTMANALLDNLPLIIDAVINMFTAMVDNLTDPDKLDEMIDTAITLISTLAEALITNVPILISKLPAIIEALVNGFITLAPKLFEASWTIISKLGEGLFENVGDLTKPIKDVFNWIKDTMGNIFSGIWKVGENLIKGLWDGIAGVKDWIIRKIRNLCSEMLSAITGFFGIQSPSKVMADQVGKYMAEGIGVGFGNTMPSVIKAMQNKLDTVTSALQSEITLGDVPQLQGNNIVSENNYVTRNYTNTVETIRQPSVIELVLDNTKVARALVPALNSEYNRLGVKV